AHHAPLAVARVSPAAAATVAATATAAAAAAVAAAATAAAAIATAAAAAAAAAPAALLPRLGLVHLEVPVLVAETVEGGDGRLRLLVRGHLDEGEAARAAGLPVDDQVHVRHLAVLR